MLHKYGAPPLLHKRQNFVSFFFRSISKGTDMGPKEVRYEIVKRRGGLDDMRRVPSTTQVCFSNLLE